LDKHIYIYSPVKDTVDLFLSSTIEDLLLSNNKVTILFNPSLSLNFSSNTNNYNTIEIRGNNTKPLSLFDDIKLLQTINNADILIFNGSATVLLSFIYKIFNPLKKNYYIMHGTLMSKGKFYNYIFLFFLFFSNIIGIHIIYVNKYFKKYFVRKNNTKFFGIAGVGVNKKDINYIISKRKFNFNIKKDFKIAFIGRHEFSKGYNLFVEIAKLNENKNCKFVSIGGDIVIDEDKCIIKYGKLNRNEVFNHFNEINLLIMPSFSEGLGMSMVECCIAGIPTIATSTDGSKQFIINNYNGLIINSRNPLDFLDGIKIVMNNYNYFSINCIRYSENNNNFISNPIKFY